MRSATMVDGRCCYGDDDHTRRRSTEQSGRRCYVLVQSAEQRHWSRWHMKEAELGGDRGGEGGAARARCCCEHRTLL